METLEHCTEDVVAAVLRDLNRLVKPDGRVIISVPIEIGPTFILKAVVRGLAAARGLSDYRYYERYSVPDALRMIAASRNTRIRRATHGEPNALSHSHHGFNWRALRVTIAAELRLRELHFTPLSVPGGLVSSQAWFVCGKRSDESGGDRS